MLIVFGGLPGTGKTTLSRALADRLRAVYLRIDRSPDHGGDGRSGHRDDAFGRDPKRHAAAGRTGPVARIDACERTRIVAGERW
ncbi:AAA family ATPase, partial [Oceanibaculum nanhaiense]|uniref:AAA family ATPase n=1 Tax=Oceanibaculum nanhaiense TaxID=1909734 RepID=UPI00396DD215